MLKDILGIWLKKVLRILCCLTLLALATQFALFWDINIVIRIAAWIIYLVPALIGCLWILGYIGITGIDTTNDT